MINKIMKEYVEKDNNIETNYKAIFSRLEGNNNMKNFKRKFLNTAAAILTILVVGTASVQVYAKLSWDIQFKEYQNREYKYGIGNKDLTENVDMEYIEQDGIKAKIDSIMITDEHFEAKVNFVFNENIELNSETLEYGFAVYDENNTIYLVSDRIHYTDKKWKAGKYNKFLCKELGISEDTRPLVNSWGIGKISSIDRNVTTKITMNSQFGFPKSKKIYIRIFDLGYYMADNEMKVMEDFNISKAEWIFEVNIPESIYNRPTINLKLKDEISGLEIKHIKATETGLIIQGNMQGIVEEFMKGKDISKEEWETERKSIIYLTDDKGNVYDMTSGGTTGEKDGFMGKFELNIDIVESNNLFLNVTIDGKQYTSELVSE